MGKTKHIFRERAPHPEHVALRLSKFSGKWIELLGEREKKMERGYPVVRIKEGEEGEIGPQLETFRELFEGLAYGDRSNYGKKLELFSGYVHLLEKLINAVKINTEKELYKFEEELAKKGIFGRISGWLYRKIMLRPGTPGWYDMLRDLAGRTLAEIDEAKRIVEEKFGIQL